MVGTAPTRRSPSDMVEAAEIAFILGMADIGERLLDAAYACLDGYNCDVEGIFLVVRSTATVNGKLSKLNRRQKLLIGCDTH